jgi:CMP/dCMP kinase
MTSSEGVDLQSAVVAIDGPSGAGKSSVSRGVARRLGLRYLDTGSMYRAMTLWMLDHGIDVQDVRAVADAAGRPTIEVGTDPRAATICVDGVDVGEAIRSDRVTSAVSMVSAVPEVRTRMVSMQRAAIGSGGIVVEGRDIGTAVAPDATTKVYLTASEEVRAVRRAAEHSVSDAETTRIAQRRRDQLDSSRPASPLRKADDAVELDATDLTLEQVIDRVVRLVRRRAPSLDHGVRNRP